MDVQFILYFLKSLLKRILMTMLIAHNNNYSFIKTNSITQTNPQPNIKTKNSSDKIRKTFSQLHFI